MGVATARPTNFVEGKGYPSPGHPRHRVRVLRRRDRRDSEDGGRLVFRFEMAGESPNPDGLDLRTFDLSPLPATVFEQVVSLLSPYSSPSWPVWVPPWKSRPTRLASRWTSKSTAGSRRRGHRPGGWRAATT